MENLEEVKAMIQGELSLITDLTERRTFKELMEGVFLSLWETNAAMYERLEERVVGELAWDMNRFCVRTGLVERESFDPVHRFLAPACEEDLAPASYKAGELRERIREEGRVRLATVFVQCGPAELKRFLDYGPGCTGRLLAGGWIPVRGVRELGLLLGAEEDAR